MFVITDAKAIKQIQKKDGKPPMVQVRVHEWARERVTEEDKLATKLCSDILTTKMTSPQKYSKKQNWEKWKTLSCSQGFWTVWYIIFDISRRVQLKNQIING